MISTVPAPHNPPQQGKLPQSFAMAALFGISRGARVTVPEFQRVASMLGYQVDYKGVVMRQSDLDLVMLLVHEAQIALEDQAAALAGQSSKGVTVKISGYALLKHLNLTGGDANYNSLNDTFSILKSQSIRTTQTSDDTSKKKLRSRVKEFNILVETEVIKDPATNRAAYAITVSTSFLALMAENIVKVNLLVRKKLKLGLASWLHVFLTAAQDTTEPLRLQITLVHSLCGSDAQNMYEFSRSLKRALESVYEADPTLFLAASVEKQELRVDWHPKKPTLPQFTQQELLEA